MDFPSSIRKTRSRIRVWEILEKAGTPLTARQIAQKAAKAGKKTGSASDEADGAVWLSSIYRALDAFEKTHAVTRTILSDSNEALYSLSGNGHHHYAICMQCKKKTELAGCPFGDESTLQAVDQDFMVVGHMVEVYGYCKSCRKKLKNENIPEPHTHTH